MTKRRWFPAEFKARVALEALRGDKTGQEIAAKHKVHPNQVSTWKRQAVDGLSEVFSNGADRAHRDHEAEVRDLHAKIGELPVRCIGMLATVSSDCGRLSIYPGSRQFMRMPASA